LGAYDQILSKSLSLGNNPYNPYQGELVPSVNAQQSLGIANVNAFANSAQPYFGTAAGYAATGANPITANQIQQYVNPWTQNVVNATQAAQANQNAIQLAQVRGNAAAQNALGGNREAVAEGITAGQQATAEAPVIAGLESQGYQQGVNTALAEQQAAAQGAFSFANLGNQVQNAGLSGANAQIGAGNLQYGVQSNLDQALYQQWLNAQAFPYQQEQWLAGIATGVGSNMGGTSQTTQPGPSLLSQLIGLGTAGLGAYGAYQQGQKTAAHGGRIVNRDVGGGIGGPPQFGGVAGGTSYPQFGGGYGAGVGPYGGGRGFVPGIGITHGHGAPLPPGMKEQAGPGSGTGGGGFADIGKSLGQIFGGGSTASTSTAGAARPVEGTADASALGAGGETAASSALGVWDTGAAADAAGTGFLASIGSGIMDALPFLAALNKGGRVKGLADGGTPDYPQNVDATDYTFDDHLGLGAGMPSYPAPGTDILPGAKPGQTGVAAPSALDAIQSNFPLPNVPRSALGYASDDVTNGQVNDPGALSSTPVLHNPQGGFRGVANPPSTQQGPSVTQTDAYHSQLAGFDPSINMGQPVEYHHPTVSPWGAIIAAGLGMAASRSPWVLQAAAEGGLGGLHEYSAEMNQAIQEEKERAGIAQGNQRLDVSTQEAQKRLEFQSKEAQDRNYYENQRVAMEQQRFNLEQSKPFTVNTILGPRTGYKNPQDGKIYDVETGSMLFDPSHPGQQGAPGGAPGAPGGAPVANANTMAAATMQGLHGAAYLNATPEPLRSIVETVGTYNASLSVASKRAGPGINEATLLGYVMQYNPEYNQFYANALGPVMKEFLSGGQNSPAGQITYGNTAMDHAGIAWDAMQRLKSMPGVLAQAGASGLPFLSYAIERLRNQSVQGTPEGVALNQYVTAMTLFGDETNRLYSGSQSAQKEKDAIRAPLDPNKTLPELEGAFRTSTALLKSRLDELEERYKVAMQAPGLLKYGTKAPAEDFPVIHDRARETYAKIHAGEPTAAAPGQPASNTPTVARPPDTQPTKPFMDRYQELRRSGLSEQDAYSKLKVEGYKRPGAP
jgi:hypothetical protein